jgi:dihydroorotase
VFEHITTKEAAQYVAGRRPHTAATITAHHLLYNRNAIFTGGLRPHYYCLPVLKREVHRQALVAAATSGSPLLPRHRQRAAPGAPEGARGGGAGCYTAPAALELYAEAFEPPARWTSWKASPASTARLLRPAAQHRHASPCAASPGCCPRPCPSATPLLKPLRGGDTLNWKLQ